MKKVFDFYIKNKAGNKFRGITFSELYGVNMTELAYGDVAQTLPYKTHKTLMEGLNYMLKHIVLDEKFYTIQGHMVDGTIEVLDNETILKVEHKWTESISFKDPKKALFYFFKNYMLNGV